MKRLELLDKTQDQIEQLTQAVSKLKTEPSPTRLNEVYPGLKSCSPLLVLQQQKQIAEELNKVIKAMNNNPTSLTNTGSNYNKMVSTKHLMVAASGDTKPADSPNSAGSEEGSVCTMGSTSDLNTER